jgi:hypothetical protein
MTDTNYTLGGVTLAAEPAGRCAPGMPRTLRRNLRYNSSEFRTASAWAQSQPMPLSASVLVRSIVHNPAAIRVLIGILRLPIVDLRARREGVAAWPEITFGPFRRRQLARAVLRLPVFEERYLSGRPRQALRTNLRHARDLGVTSARVRYGDWLEAVSEILKARPLDKALEGNWARPGPGQQAAHYVTYDASGKPLAFAGTALFGQFAVLFALLSHPGRHPEASWARYQLHTFLALDLGRTGVEYLLVGSALRESPGNQYFQHLLGYRARNLRITCT